MPEKVTDEEQTLYDILVEDKHDAIASSVMAVYYRGKEIGAREAFRRGAEWGKSGMSHWWWMPTLALTLIGGSGFGMLVMWALLTPVN